MDLDDRSATSINISLPEALRAFAEERVASSSFPSASEYVRELIRKDRERYQKRLEELLLEGLESGPATEWTEQDWTSIRERVTKRQGRAAQEDLERKLEAGLDSGDPIEITPEHWEQKRRDLIERHRPKS